MIVFPPAKINLGLNVVRRRSDGYHDIESVLVPIPLHDALEAIVDKDLPPGELVLTRSGLPVPGDPAQDLCHRAVQAIARLRALPGLRLHLHKVIPMGAGLGGGSSDAAHTLLLLNTLLQLGLERSELRDMAAGLGSDVPFFLEDGAQLAEGRGERLRHVQLDVEGRWLMLVNPGVHVPTADVYRNTVPTELHVDLVRVLENEPMEAWTGRVVNTMEPYVIATYPVVAEVRRRLQDAGGVFVAMSGSGSTVFGIFNTEPPELAWPPDHRAWRLRW